MHAMRAGTLPLSRAENNARRRPELRVVYRAEAPVTAPPPAALPIPARQQARTPLRLTRRGRVVVAAATVLLVAALSLIAAGAAQAISRSAAPRPAGRASVQVVVRPGQSLWSVAESADPNADTRLVIQRIIELNALSGNTVFAGQRLWVPRS